MEYQNKATGTSRHLLQLPNHDPESMNADLVLQDEDVPELRIRIGELIRRERHADVYSVYWDALDHRIEDSEARAFVLDGVPGKLKRHRKRCIQRLSPRAWWNESCRGAEVIIYRVNNKAAVVTPEEEDTDSSKTSQRGLVPMKKTNYKREAARMRQRERRRQNAPSSSPQETELIKDDVSPSEDLEDAFRGALLLYVFFDTKGNKRSVKSWDVPISYRISFKLMDLFTLLLAYEHPISKLELDQILTENDWLCHDILLHLEDLKLQFSKMSFRELFTGVHSVLTTPPSELYYVLSTDHRADLLRHIQATLPRLIDDFHTMGYGGW